MCIRDRYNSNQFHPIFLLPCEREDRLYDVNKNIEASLLAINNWFEKKTNNQTIRFDKKINGNFDVTFLRVNKTMDWFGDLETKDEDVNITEVSEKIEKIINDNSHFFNNFSSKTKSPLSLKLNTILKVIFFVLVLIGIILILPRFGFNPLALVQKVLPLLGML